MTNHPIASQQEWLAARRELLQKEKQFTQLRDQLSAQRRQLPWVKIEKAYTFQGSKGAETLAQLFEGKHQLVVYHLMFAPENERACKNCSFWADHFGGIEAHLRQRDTSFAAISRAPLEKLRHMAKQLGWTFKWVSCGENGFNHDFGTSFTSCRGGCAPVDRACRGAERGSAPRGATASRHRIEVSMET